MKTLILFRHGKSDWDAGESSDHDRPLAKRGRKAAKAMGKFLALAGQVPDAAVTSSAVRARSSLEIAMDAGGWNCPVRVARSLYEAAPLTLLKEVCAEPAGTQRLLLTGHEPALSEFASLLIGGGELEVPTACMIRIDLEGESWAGVAYGSGSLIWVVPPRLLTDGDLEL